MNGYSDELRLLCLLLLNAAVFAAAWRFSRNLLDTILIGSVVQYLAVGLPGMLGMLGLWSSSAVAAAAAIFLWMWAGATIPSANRRLPSAAILGKRASPENSRRRKSAVAVVALFAAGYAAAVVGQLYVLPPSDTDALTYHLPAAVQWIRTGSLRIFPAWYVNPANTYSPLGGSIFLAWLLLPLGNDMAARFAQLPMLPLIFAAVLELSQELGLSDAAAACVALAAILNRAIFGEAVLVKDDLFVCGFFLAAAAAALTPRRLADRGGAVRLGAAVGLMLAIKYTALLGLPMLAVAIDAPVRAGWGRRRWLAAAGVAVLLAGPWYLRNLFQTGNPIFPVDLSLGGIHLLHGILTPAPSQALQTGEEVWHVLTGTYFSIAPALLIVLAIGWAAALVSVRWWKNPLARLSLIGPVIGIGWFVFRSPYGEVRFVYPAFLLMLLCIAMVLNRLPAAWRWAAALATAGLAVATVYDWTEKFAPLIETFLLGGIVTVAVGLAAAAIWRKTIRTRDARTMVFICGGVVLAIVIYVFWSATVAECRQKADWVQTYGPTGQVWQFVRKELPADATIAYANTSMVYPLMGFDWQHRVVYAPVRAGLDSIRQLPPLAGGRPLSGENIMPAMAAAMNQNADRKIWLANLRDCGAQYLVVFNAEPDPPELRFVREDPGRFERLFANEAGAVYRVIGSMSESQTHPLEFQVLHRDSGTAARAGRISTRHGTVDTPTFMPVGTQGSVKGVLPDHVAATGTQIVLANTYHLMLRPGEAVVAELGGLHKFMGWSGSILTDSGGFQVFSLSDLNRIDDEGVIFKSHIDGAMVRLTPQRAMQVQNALGADIIMAFDQCPAASASPQEHVEAVRRTLRWARICAQSHARPADQALFGIVQGGTDIDLRRRCAEGLLELDFPGYAIGGLAVGEGFQAMRAVLQQVTPMLPADRPRYLMGVGYPRDLAAAVACGVDMFDCVLPTRNGRNASAFTAQGSIRLRNGQFQRDSRPIEAGCDCYACRNFSRGALRHYFFAGEMLGPILVSVHNIRFYQRLMTDMRQALADGRFGEFARTDVRCSIGPAELVGGTDAVEPQQEIS